MHSFYLANVAAAAKGPMLPMLDVPLFLFDIALIIVLARLLGQAAKRIGQPPVLGEIVAGILLGPTIWGTGITSKTGLFPPTLIPPLTAIATIGLVLFMFVIGYEVDMGLVRGRERVAGGVAIGSIAAPLILGCGLGVWLIDRYHVQHPVRFVLFVGVAMSITAFPVLARILSDRGLHRTRVGGLALAAASVDDVLAWALLAIVLAIAGSGSGQMRWPLALAPVYAAVMIWLVKPALRKIAEVYQRQGRLTPNVLAAVLALLLLSSFATEWIGVKFIFGAFILGILMPREFPELREAILERLEQVSVIVLLPVFFVTAGLKVNIRGISPFGLVNLVLIMLVAVAGKFGGAYFGARLTGVRRRQSGALASLMNTRGLTEIVILTVGLSAGIVNKHLFTLMVVMAVVTTGMAGPLLNVIYPNRIMERDIAEADRAALGQAAAHRILVLIEDLATAGPLIDVAARLASSRPNSELVLSHLVPHRAAGRLEVGAGLGGELLQMTQTMASLQALAAEAAPDGVVATVQSRFSDNVEAELPGYVAAAEPDTIVLRPGGADGEALSRDGAAQLVYAMLPLPPEPTAAAAIWARGADGDAAVQVAGQLSVAGRLDLVVAPAGRPRASIATELSKRGLSAVSGPAPDGAILVGAASQALESQDESRDDFPLHLAVVAGTQEASDDMDAWVEALTERATEAAPAGSTRAESMQTVRGSADTTSAGGGRQESRQP